MHKGEGFSNDMSLKTSLNLINMLKLKTRMFDFLKDVDLIGRNTKLLYKMSRGERKNIGTFKKSGFSFDEEFWFKKSHIILQ